MEDVSNINSLFMNQGSLTYVTSLHWAFSHPEAVQHKGQLPKTRRHESRAYEIISFKKTDV